MTKILSLVFGVVLMVSFSSGVAAAADKTKVTQGKVTQGKVTAASNDSLTIEAGGKSLTFAVDGTTKVLGKGLSTMMQEKKAKGESFTFTDGVAVDDMVKVSYHDMDGKLHAAQVTVVQKHLSAK